MAGTVDALGEGTDASWLGRRVVAHLGMAPGGYAELAVVDASKLHALPDHVGEAEAVAMIGTLLVQYAKNAGATVIGLAGGPEKVARVKENGADLAVDYKRETWPEEVRAFLGSRKATVVFDSVGGETGRAAVDLVGKGGLHLVFGWSSAGLHDGEPLTFTEEELATRGITSESVLGPGMLEKAGGVRNLELAALTALTNGTLRPAIHRFPLSEAAKAHHALETRGTIGKVVLVP